MKRALGAAQAAGVTRVVLTPSVVAIQAKDNPNGAPFTEADWSDLDHPTATAYAQSKTLAEQAAWRFSETHQEMRLTAINPALVLGSPLDRHYGTSLQLIERIALGKDPMVPDVGFGVVDVEDVSAMHLAALERPESAGARYIASAGTASLPEIARHLASAYPDRRIPTRIAPKLVLQALSLFDRSIKTVLPVLGDRPDFDARKALNELGIAFTDWKTSVERAAKAVLQVP